QHTLIRYYTQTLPPKCLMPFYKPYLTWWISFTTKPHCNSLPGQKLTTSTVTYLVPELVIVQLVPNPLTPANCLNRRSKSSTTSTTRPHFGHGHHGWTGFAEYPVRLATIAKRLGVLGFAGHPARLGYGHPPAQYATCQRHRSDWTVDPIGRKCGR